MEKLTYLTFILFSSILLFSCAKRITSAQGRLWLDSKSGDTDVNITGSWDGREWGIIKLEQIGNELKRTYLRIQDRRSSKRPDCLYGYNI